MRRNVRTAGTLLVTAAMFAVAAGPASAASRGSLAKTELHVHAANGALSQLNRLAPGHQRAASRALARGQADIAAAARLARSLRARGATRAAATAFEGVAIQYDRDVQTYASLLKRSSGAFRIKLAHALMPALSGRTQALGVLAGLAPTLSASMTGTATGTISTVIGNAPGELASLNSALNVAISVGDVPAEQLIATAVTTAGGVVDAGVAELEGLIPTVTASVQGTVQAQLATAMGALSQVEAILGQVTTTVDGTIGTATTAVGGALGTTTGAVGTIGTELGQVTSILQTLLGNLGSLGLSTAGSGTIGVGVTGTITTGAGVNGTVTPGTGATVTATTGTGILDSLTGLLSSLLAELGINANVGV